MNDKLTSTLIFKSNLQPINENHIMDDKMFLSNVRDPFGLEILDRTQQYTFTEIQEKEFKNASMHCTYAFKDDYPWGTVIDSDGKEKVVCKCLNTKCAYFNDCRPDFNEDELIIAEENVLIEEKLVQALREIEKPKKINIQDRVVDKDNLGDTIAATAIFATDISKVENKHNKEVENIEKCTIEAQKDDREEIEKVVDDASFESFINVEQNEIIESSPIERTIVNAGPGTGKTWTLVEKLKYMLTTQSIDPENIVVLCFSRDAVDVIRCRLENAAKNDELPLNWHMIDVRTFDSFATYMIAWVQENIPELLPDKYSLEKENYEQRIKTATTILINEKDMLVEYEHVIVDEVQDLVGVRAEMVLALLKGLPESCGFTLLGDSCQALYDYLSQDNKNIMPSSEFYKIIFHDFSMANYYSLECNYRQGDEFGKLTIPYRNAILSENKEKRVNAVSILNNELKKSALSLKEMTKDQAEILTKNGTVGILTRTNGQALQISAWLRNEGIKHTLQKPVTSMDLAEWIGKILQRAETDVIDYDEFEKSFCMEYPDMSTKVKRFWEALISTQINQTKNHYEIEDLLRGLLHNAKHPLLFEEPYQHINNITISNIHRAKGREFDYVLVLEDVVAGLTEEENDDELEHKVCYVALTRPKKKIEKIYLKPQFIYISKDEYRKCFRSGGFANRKYLSHYEIGDGGDLNMRSFARDEDTQNYIKEKLLKDSRLKLLKCPKGTNNYVTYKVVLEEDENRVLGYTSWDFAIGMERAIQRVFSNYHSIDYKYFPSIFGEIYFDGLTTCVSTNDKGIDGAKKIGSMYIWNGISISGFAQIEKDRY